MGETAGRGKKGGMTSIEGLTKGPLAKKAKKKKGVSSYRKVLGGANSRGVR